MQITEAHPYHIAKLNSLALKPLLKEQSSSREAIDSLSFGQEAKANAPFEQIRQKASEVGSKAFTKNSVQTKKLEEMIALALSNPEAEKQLITTLQALNASGQLKPVMQTLIEQAAASGALPPLPPQAQAEMAAQAAGMVDAQFRERGLTPDTKGVIYKDWEQLSAEHLNAIRSTQAPPRIKGSPSNFANNIFIKELEELQGAKFRSGNAVKALIDGPASFKERDQMLEKAKSSISLMSWAFYDDTTGWDTARKLVEKAKQGVDVKVMVDGQVSRKAAHNAPIKFLEENNIPVVRWSDPNRPYDGNHRKMMIVDGQEAIVGGLNIGDVYSHKAGNVKWRDTDLLFSGPAVSDGSKLFAELWNQQVKDTNLPSIKLENKAQPQLGSSRTAIVNHIPGPKGDAHIMLATMKAIEGASESVDIENAYFISTPGLKDVLLKALADGVKVRILTNSAQSIDEPIISAPILASLPELMAAGAEVYLKKGDTLHSKFMVCDGIFSSVGSHNHHPRSQRFEGEMVANSLDPSLAQSLTSAFEADILAAEKIDKLEQLNIPDSPLGTLAVRYFFDSL